MYRITLLLLALVLTGVPAPAAAAPSTCAELAVSDAAVARLWADYTAYQAAHDKTGALIAGKAFSHELDVAGGYLEGCPDRHLQAQYYLYALRVGLDAFPVLDSIADKRDAARREANDLSELYRNGSRRKTPLRTRA